MGKVNGKVMKRIECRFYVSVPRPLPETEGQFAPFRSSFYTAQVTEHLLNDTQR